MVLPELLREIENRGVTLEPAGDRLRFRPKRNLTPDLIEGLRQHKTEILKRLEASNPATVAGLEVSKAHHEPLIRDAAEVLELARARLGEMALESREEPPYPPLEPGRDPMAHKHTDKALYFAGARRRELERRKREGLPPWVRLVDGGGAA